MTDLHLPAGYSIHISGSGVNLVLKHRGEVLDYWPASCDARHKLTARAWAHQERLGQLPDKLQETGS